MDQKERQDILLETGTNELEIAEFGINLKGADKCQSFGINVAKVREIIKVPEFVKIPESHKDVIGIFKLRDKIIPLINLGSWLNAKTECDMNKAYVIVTEFNQDNFGFLVHNIETIHRMSWTKVMPPVNIVSDIKQDCLTGVVLLERKANKIMMMIDFEKIIAEINPEMGLRLKTDKDVIDSLDASNNHMRVVLAEDSGFIRGMLVSTLEKGGFDVIAVNNGQLAWDQIDKFHQQAKKEKKDIREYVTIVVTDIEMPQMDGHSLTKKIKDDSELKKLPVILFSSLIYDEIRRKGEKLGADAQISKPEIGNLLKIIKDVLEKRKNT